MHETKWYCGYRCDIVSAGSYPLWFAELSAPRWHPVRLYGLPDCAVFLMRGMWRIFTDCVETLGEARGSAYDMAEHLQVMQEHWAALSPFEREYQVW